MSFDDPTNRAIAIQALCKQLLQNSDPDVRYAAAEALAEIGLDEAIPALANAAECDDSTAVQQAAIRAIGKIGRSPQTSNIEINQVNIYGNISVAQYFVEATVHIQQVLNRIAQENLANPYHSDAIDQIIQDEIKQNPDLKTRLVSAFKAGGIEALKAIFNHPVVTVPIEMIMGFLEP